MDTIKEKIIYSGNICTICGTKKQVMGIANRFEYCPKCHTTANDLMREEARQIMGEMGGDPDQVNYLFE